MGRPVAEYSGDLCRPEESRVQSVLQGQQVTPPRWREPAAKMFDISVYCGGLRKPR